MLQLPIRTLREIDILHHLKHDNVVNLIEVCRSRGTQYMYETGFYLVLEFYDHDLAGLLSNGNVTITVGERKNLMLQLLHGLCYVHSNKVCIDNMKPANIILTKAGILKLADFGLARPFTASQCNRDGNTEHGQLKLITDLFVSVNRGVWPGVESLPLYNKIELPRGGKRKVC
ncbi:hypothetical protein B7P43_G17799 [Cryptotermes secundus]|uniref:Protein kinase domain-containing protein n=1 Tax=Cryptotermes secundus TaxID=105785 RepID=A0A2J7R487_9NEOP|nr:hypothetical protein B7P43_G17799 [Cryptotermes secundus]